MSQLHLLSPESAPPGTIVIPDIIHQALLLGAALVISISGGKDSICLLRRIVQWFRQQSYPGKLIALHAHLGRIEHAGVLEFLQSICQELEVELIVVRHDRSMVEEWQARWNTLAKDHKAELIPFWSSETTRFCTKSTKTSPSNKLYRRVTSTFDPATAPPWSSETIRFCTDRQKSSPSNKSFRKINADNLIDCVISAEGLRAEEGRKRALKPLYCVRSEITTKHLQEPPKTKTAQQRQDWAISAFDQWVNNGYKGRFGLTWNAIHPFSESEVWQGLGTTIEEVSRRRQLFQEKQYREAFEGFVGHWIYIALSSRLSCSMCVLANNNDVLVGAKFNPFVWLELCLMEMLSGWGFRGASVNQWLISLAPRVVEFVQSRERSQIFQVLYEIGAIKSWQPCNGWELWHFAQAQDLWFWCKLVASADLTLIACWTEEALVTIAAHLQIPERHKASIPKQTSSCQTDLFTWGGD
jgi:3'-phosphoadenosine 5'-phosphosulfate sulfotransferase (PAPS reductase)/FAD synthetase